MICPFWQKPHCGTCSSIQACCSGCSLPSLASPSSVVISRLDGGRRRDARPDRRAIDDHGARPALAKSATKPRTLQAEIVAQDIEQRSRRVDIHGVRLAVHLQCDVAHRLHVSIRLGRCTAWSRESRSGVLEIKGSEIRRTIVVKAGRADVGRLRPNQPAVAQLLQAVCRPAEDASDGKSRSKRQSQGIVCNRIVVSFFTAPGRVALYFVADRTIWSIITPSSRV